MATSLDVHILGGTEFLLFLSKPYAAEMHLREIKMRPKLFNAHDSARGLSEL